MKSRILVLIHIIISTTAILEELWSHLVSLHFADHFPTRIKCALCQTPWAPKFDYQGSIHHYQLPHFTAPECQPKKRYPPRNTHLDQQYQWINSKITWVGKDFQDHLVPTPLTWLGAPSSRSSCSKPCSGAEHSQRWVTHSSSGIIVPVPCYP